MNSKLFLLGAASLLLASCSNELDVPVSQAIADGGTTPLGINVLANPTTKALVEGNTIPSGQIGVKLVDAGGSTYDNLSYNNIFYSTTDGASWTVDPDHKILLSATEGKAYAYYPYSSDVSDFTAISISSAADPAQQVDYMYGNEATGLKNSNPTASFTMSHAMSIVNFTIAKGTYTGTGSITSVKMKGNTASNTGTMNAVAGTVTATAAGYEFESTNSLTLGSASGKFIVVPSGVSSALDFKVVMDGQTYTASTTDVTLESGKVYKYTLTMSSTGLTINTVTVTPWGSEQNKGSLDTNLMTFADLMHEKFQGITTDGVYAVKSDGTPVAYSEASDDSYAAVAFVIKCKAYQVAKADATYHDGSYEVYWDKNNYTDLALTNYTKVDGTNSTGCLDRTDSPGIPQLSQDPSTWGDGALSDFNGQANTATILSAQSDGTLDYTIGKAVMNFRSGSNNEDHDDWFIPACGELAYMYLKMTELNTLLGKVSGTALTGTYWSSTEYGSDFAWYVHFWNGDVYSVDKSYYYRLRLVRAI